MNLWKGDHVRSDTMPGVAFWFVGFREDKPTEECDCRWDCDGPARCECWHHMDVDADTAVVIAVGDDQMRFVPTSSLHVIDEDEFCGGCGQIGCGHG